MKPKKSKRANLENYRTIFLQIGLILTLSAILFAFEWKTKVDLEKLEDNRTGWTGIEEIVPITRPKAEVPKKIDPPSFELEVVKDELEIEDVDLSHLISEIGEGEPIVIYEFDEKDEVVNDEPVIIAEFMPTFQGKDVRHFRNYISENVKFPPVAVEYGIAGTVIVAFVVDKDGTVSDVEILRKVDPLVDEAVLKVIKNSPKWEPGLNNGRKVRVRFTIAIKFDLI